MGVRFGPRSQLGEESVHVIAGFRGKLIFDPPDFSENGVRFHTLNLPQDQSVCKFPATPVGARP
jgi:hypothetical protein